MSNTTDLVEESRLSNGDSDNVSVPSMSSADTIDQNNSSSEHEDLLKYEIKTKIDRVRNKSGEELMQSNVNRPLNENAHEHEPETSPKEIFHAQNDDLHLVVQGETVTNRDRANTDISDVTMVEVSANQSAGARLCSMNVDGSIKGSADVSVERNTLNFPKPPKIPVEPSMLRFSSAGSSNTDTETDDEIRKINKNDNRFPKFYDSDGDSSQLYNLSPKQDSRESLSIETFEGNSMSNIDDRSAASFLPRMPEKSYTSDAYNSRSNSSVVDEDNQSMSAQISNQATLDLKPKKNFILPYHLRKKVSEENLTGKASSLSFPTPPIPQKASSYQRKYMNFPKVPNPPSKKASSNSLESSTVTMVASSTVQDKFGLSIEDERYQRRHMEFPPNNRGGQKVVGPTPPIPGRLGLPPSGNRSRINSADNPIPPVPGNRIRNYSGDKGKPSTPLGNQHIKTPPTLTSIKQRPHHQVDVLGMPQPKLRPVDNRVRKGSFDANGPLLRRVRSSSIDSGSESDGSIYTGSIGGSAAGLAAKLADDVKQFLIGGEQPTRMVENYGSIQNGAATEFHNQNQDFLKHVQLEQNRYTIQGSAKPLATWGDIQPVEPRKSPVRSQSPRPPNTRGKHRVGLPSIENDNWDDMNEEVVNRGRSRKKKKSQQPFTINTDRSSRQVLTQNENGSESGSQLSSSSCSDTSESEDESDEMGSLLPPSGIRTSESETSSRKNVSTLFREGYSSYQNNQNNLSPISSDEMEYSTKSSVRSSARSSRSSRNGSRKSRKSLYRGLSEKRLKELHDIWEQDRIKRDEARKCFNRFKLWLEAKNFSQKFYNILAKIEVLISNLPNTAAGLAVSYSSMGNIWYKYMEMNNVTCLPVAYRSPECTFPEFPGCFECNVEDETYQIGLIFHYSCQIICLIFGVLFLMKLIMARQVIADEISNPITMTPLGLYCIAMVVIAVGKGLVGYLVVVFFSLFHFVIFCWFTYSVLAYNLLPDPSWFPNTVGIGMTAIKLWVYHPYAGYSLMILSLLSCFAFFPVALYRVFVNKKMSATVAWMVVSGPSSACYSATLLGQPSLFDEEHMDITSWKSIHIKVYIPFLSFLFFLSVIGMLTSCYSLRVRWKDLIVKGFSPAHVAFCFATLNHANVCQAYLSSIDAYLPDFAPPGSFLNRTLYTYWCTVLFLGSVATLIITVKFLLYLPSWVFIDVDDEEEPPAPNETLVGELIDSGETIKQKFVSPAVLQANETGALVRVGGHRYVRTRRLTALGFEPIMNWMEMARERELLLEHVAKHPPKTRTRTLSVPGIDISFNFGSGGGVWDDDTVRPNRARSNTAV